MFFWSTGAALSCLELILDRKSSISLKFHWNSTVGFYSKLHRDLARILEICSLLPRAKNLFACQEAPNGLYISFLGTPRGLPPFCQTEFSKSVSESICGSWNFRKIRKWRKSMKYQWNINEINDFRKFSDFSKMSGPENRVWDTFRKFCLTQRRKTPRSA